MTKRSFLVWGIVALLLVIPLSALAANITCSTDPCNGTDNNDVIHDDDCAFCATTIYAKAGQDYVYAHGNDDIIKNSTGYDTFRGHAGDDYVSGGENGTSLLDADYVIGNTGNDTVNDDWAGNAELDHACGGDGSDRIVTNDADDYDWYSGGAGNDQYDTDGTESGGNRSDEDCTSGA